MRLSSGQVVDPYGAQVVQQPVAQQHVGPSYAAAGYSSPPPAVVHSEAEGSALLKNA
jgi:hypothetical protein